MHQHRTLQRLFPEWEAVPKMPLLDGLLAGVQCPTMCPNTAGQDLEQAAVLEHLMLKRFFANLAKLMWLIQNLKKRLVLTSLAGWSQSPALTQP